MKTICYIKFNKYRKFKTPKKSYIFNKTLILYIICSKYGNNNCRKNSLKVLMKKNKRFIEKFKLHIKCYRIATSVENIQKVKKVELPRQMKQI